LSATDGPTVVCHLMASSDGAQDVLLLVAPRGPDNPRGALLVRSDGANVDLFDQSGGMRYSDINEVSSWGDWGEAHSLEHVQCLANCVAGKLPRWLLRLDALRDLANLLKPLLYTSDCMAWFTKGTIGTRDTCAARIAQALAQHYGKEDLDALLGDYTMLLSLLQCQKDCIENPDSHRCTHCQTYYQCVWGANGGWKIHCLYGGLDFGTLQVFLCGPDETCRSGWNEGCKPLGNNGGASGGEVTPAHDPNKKYGPNRDVLPNEQLDYKVEYENEGEGIAFGVYFTDTLDPSLDDSTLKIGPVVDVDTGKQIGGVGTYNPETRTITWFVGQVDPRQGGYADFGVNVKDDAPAGTEIINVGTVYFPSVPEETKTNAIVSAVGVGGDVSAQGGADIKEFSLLAMAWLESDRVDAGW